MIRRLLIASICATALVAPAPAPARASAEQDYPPAKRVVREYGGPPVVLLDGQTLTLRFKGERGDRVGLGVVYRSHAGPAYYFPVGMRRPAVRWHGRYLKQDGAGYVRLKKDGWHNIRYQASSYDLNVVQLFKQVRVTHSHDDTTLVPQRRGYQYGVRVRPPKRGVRVVSFGTQIDGVMVDGTYSSHIETQSLIFGPGLPIYAGHWSTEPLAPNDRAVVMVAPTGPAKVVSAAPTVVGRSTVDGPPTVVPGGGKAVITDFDATGLAGSAQQLLNLMGPRLSQDWRLLVLSPDGELVEPTLPPGRLYQLPDATGIYRVLAFPISPTAPATELEFDSVVDGGTVEVDGGQVTVPAQADGRFTLLSIVQPTAFLLSDLTVTDVTVSGGWTVYAGNIKVPPCMTDPHLVCNGYEYGARVSSIDSFGVATGGYVLTMPWEGQTAGSFKVGLHAVAHWP